jgi:hypothetical protein
LCFVPKTKIQQKYSDGRRKSDFCNLQKLIFLSSVFFRLEIASERFFISRKGTIASVSEKLSESV